MRFIIAAIGKLKQGPQMALYEEYAKRIPWKITLKELEDKNPSPAIRKEKEGALLLGAVKACERIIVLDERGKQFTSQNFAKLLGGYAQDGTSTVGLVIGGSDGVAEEVRAKAHLVLSLGSMTLPHQLARVLLLEQLYRSYTILTNHPYHRE